VQLKNLIIKANVRTNISHFPGEMECSSKTTEEECNCTLYWMPRKFSNGSKICNRKKAFCYEKVLYNIAHSAQEKYSCSHCLPACFEINYGREISSSKLGTGGFLTAENISNRNVDDIHDNLAILHIFFIDNSYGGFTKSELIGFTEFLSNTGL
jgi:Amiloride-sensitive sodium channel